ncbi:MFS transporter [Bacillus sp. SCS-151]|uniref:MFS transporter n=1 Tax=Nanhaiella sioensis TaxID=3115293 RepID=UPI00397CC2E1
MVIAIINIEVMIMYKKIFQNRNFLRFFLGGAVSQLGDRLTGWAFLFLTIEMTGSALHTTGMVIAETIPYVLFGLIGGVVADQVNKKKLLIIIDMLRAPIILSLVIIEYMNLLTYPVLLVFAFIIQSFGCFFNPCHRAMLPAITSIDERTVANSLIDTVSRGISVLGPFIAILFINTVGVIHFFTFDVFSYLISAFFIFKIQINETKSIVIKKSLFAAYGSIKEFFMWVQKNVQVRNLFTITFIVVFFNTWVWDVGILLMIVELSDKSETIYSTLQGVFGLVVVSVNLLIPLIFKQMNLKTYLYGSLVWGIGIVILTWTTQLYTIFIAIIIIGIGMPMSGLSRVFLIQKLVPEHMHGRGFSFNAVLLYLANVLSLSLFGILTLFINIQTIFLLSGLIIILTSLYSLSRILFSKHSWGNIVHFLK